MKAAPATAETPKHERNLIGVVQVSSALSLGTLAGLLYSVKAVVPIIRFQFSGATVIAFLLAAAASIAFWRVAFQLSADGDRDGSARGRSQTKARRVWLGTLAGLLGSALVLAFAYPIKDFSREKASEIGFGATIAVVFLTVLAVIFWRVVRFLEADQPGQE